MARYITNVEKNDIRNLYNSRYAQFGRSYKTAGWGSTEDQCLRFEILFRDVDARGKSIIDVGCGLGDLIPFLDLKTGGDYDYLGIDISEFLLEDARKKFSSARRHFLLGDVLEMKELTQANIIILSGALNFRIKDNEMHARSMIQRMFELSTEIACVNFLSSYVDFRMDKNYYYSPESVFSFAKTLTKWVSLYCDYPLWEFTIQLRHLSRSCG